ncbi:MAG: DUF4403 family protein, partial [Acetobacteraceae bacterium]|nr:DUF4403 family protein [Acetobacteraceae bacterium]
WLEIRPVKAFAAQPRIDAAAVTLSIGVEADTRIVPAATEPDCPFPANLEIVPQAGQGQVKIAVPVDVPFIEVNRLIGARLASQTFKADKAGMTLTVRGATVVPSGERLLISLRVSAAGTRSWLGLGGEATIHVWARPVLDAERQVVRLADVALDVESEAAYGLLAGATGAARSYLEAMIAQNAVVDLRPFAANARTRIETALADFQAGHEGVRVEAAITDLRLVGIAFDADTLRIITEAARRAA